MTFVSATPSLDFRVARPVRLRRGRLLIAVAACILAVVSTPAWGQAPAPAPAEGSNIVQAGRSYAVDGAIVVALMGLALFVICRSSRRN